LQTAKSTDAIELQAAKSEGANYKLMAESFKQAFDLGLANLRRRSVPRSHPDRRSWKDKWDGQY